MRPHVHEHPESQRRSRIGVAQAVGLGLVAASLAWGLWLLHERPVGEEVELLPGTVLPSSELAIVEAAFDRAQLTGHRTEDGRVWVPRPRQSAYMRALVDAEALPREFGSSLRRALEGNSPWQSRAVQEELLRVAVQEELAHVICSMPGIERAAVLYDVDDRPSVRLGDVPARTASVNVRTQPDAELEPARVQAIRVLVAASIAGLDPERVAVTDLRSGRVFAGPLDAAASEPLAADPVLARRAAHERYLAGKLRQGLSFVRGAVIDVTVGFAAAPSLPAPATLQRVADANAPAAVSAADQPPPSPSAADGPDMILVSVAIPAGSLAAAGDEASLRQHVLALLPPGRRPEDRRVTITLLPDAGSRRGGAAVPLAERSAEAPSAVEGRFETLAAAVRALREGRPGDVPREAWLVVIAIAAAVLAWLVLRGPVATGSQPGRRRRPERIDWSGLETPAAEERTEGSSSRRVAA